MNTRRSVSSQMKLPTSPCRTADIPAGAEVQTFCGPFAARLKPCPFKAIGEMDLIRGSLSIFRFFATALLLTLGALLCASQARAGQLTATYGHGNLSVTIPYNSSQEGSGKLTVEILDPEDKSVGRVERAGEIHKGNGSWQQTIAPDKHVPFEDILWHRLRYRFEYDGARLPAIEGIESISQIIRRPVVRVLGDKEYMAGSQAVVRVIVSEANSNIAQTGALRVDLLVPNREPLRLFAGNLNRRGTVEAGLRFPADLTGDYQLRFAVDTPIGSADYTEPIQLKDRASILLTTEKPIYQPGQTIHARALALDRAAGRAAGNRKLTFELEDSRGNKVFRKATETDKFGIASAEFALADEVNLGAYHLRALMGETQAPTNTAEITLELERYVLPKFKVAIEFTEKNNKPRRDYRPGDHVTGTVRANYFFGKPVDHAEIAVKASSMDVAVFEAASSTGKTDGDGAYPLRSQAARLLRRPPAQPGRSARARRGHRHRLRRSCGDPRRTHHHQRVAAADHRGAGGRRADSLSSRTRSLSWPRIPTAAPQAPASPFTLPTATATPAKSPNKIGSSRPMPPALPCCA